MIIYLVRHLATEYNRNGIYMGRSQDLPILKSEIDLFIERTKKFLDRSVLEKSTIHSSPSLRCRQTGGILLNLSGVTTEIEVKEAFAETNYGSFEGKTSEEIKQISPIIFQNWMEKPSQVRFPEGESFDEVTERVLNELRIITQKGKKEDVAFIVTHVDVIKVIVCWILGMSIDNKRMFRIDNGSFTCLETTDERNNSKKIKVKALNVL